MIHKPNPLVYLVLLVIAGCSLPGQGTAAPIAWIDAPMNNSSHPLAPLVIVFHAADKGGIDQVQIRINGIPFADVPNASPDSLVTLKQTWEPTGPGKYKVEVRVRNKAGAWSDFSQTVVVIGGDTTPGRQDPTRSATLPPRMTPTPQPTSSPIITVTPRPSFTNTLQPRPTATNILRPTATNTPRLTATNTPRPTATNTPRPTATNTPRPTATNTPRPTATNTPRPLPTATDTPRFVPSPTNTDYPTREPPPTDTPTPERRSP